MNTRHKILKCLQWSVLSAAAFSMVACESEDFILDAISTDKNDVVCTEDTTEGDFKQIAYWSENDDTLKDTLEDIFFSKLTHIIYDKIGVESDGSLIISSDLDEELDNLVDAVISTETLVLFSIGNDSGTAFKAIANSSDARKTFNEQIKDLFNVYDIDGIDINWQFPSKDDEDDFETLIESVKKTVDDEDKLLSFVVEAGDGDSLTDSVSDDALDDADFINILATEEVSDSEYSSLDDAKESITYWTDERCIVKNKLVIGIPAQGISKAGITKSFADIFSDDNSDACIDKTSSLSPYYYNGIPTVTDKTAYAKSNAGGVVLTSLQSDIFDSKYIANYSLLTTIDSQANDSPNEICGN